MLKYILITLIIPVFLSAQTDLNYNIKKFENKEYETAEKGLKNIIDKDPNNLKAYEYLGDTYAAQEKWDKAIDAFKHLLDKKPDNADYNFKYGGALGLKAKSADKFTALFLLDDVKKYLNRAAKLDANHVEVRWALMELYLELPGIIGGSISKAKNFASQLNKISPVDGALAYGRIAEYKDDFENAEKYYKEAVNIGGSKTCYNKLINLYVKNKKFDKALATTSHAAKNLNNNDFNFKYAEIAFDANIETKNAIVYIDRFIENYTQHEVSLDEALVLKSKLSLRLDKI